MELFAKLDVVNLILAAVVVTFFASAIIIYFPKLFNKPTKKKSLVLVTALIVTTLNVSVITEAEFVWQDYVKQFMLTWAFSLLFYSLIGKWFVNWFFDKLKIKLSGGKLPK